MPPGPPTLPDDLLTALRGLDSVDALRRALADLLTPSEIEALTERWEIVKRLDDGMTQRAISEAIGASVTTVSRGSRQLKYGAGGFRLLLDGAPRAEGAGAGETRRAKGA